MADRKKLPPLTIETIDVYLEALSKFEFAIAKRTIVEICEQLRPGEPEEPQEDAQPPRPKAP